MPTPRKLTQAQEREVALSYLCGVPIERIEQEYDVSEATIRNLIVQERSVEWEDPLVEQYRSTDARKRTSNALHFILGACHRLNEGEPGHFFYNRKDQPVYGLINDAVLGPQIEAMISRTSLDEYVQEDHPYTRLVSDVFHHKSDVPSVVKRALFSAIEKEYRIGRSLDLEGISSRVGDEFVTKVRSGAFDWSAAKKALVHDTLDGMKMDFRDVLTLRYGLRGHLQPFSMQRIAEEMRSSRTKATTLYQRAMRSLRRPNTSRRLHVLVNYVTDAEVREHMDALERREERERWKVELYAEMEEEFLVNVVRDQNLQRRLSEATNDLELSLQLQSVEDLELSTRSSECLGNAGIETLYDLVCKSEGDLLKTKNFGRKSLAEIKGILGDLGLRLGMIEPPARKEY